MIKNRLHLLLSTLLTLATIGGTLWADVKPNAIFSDGAVLQRGVAIPVWGTAEPGEKIQVSLDGQTASTTADSEGNWRVQLPAHDAGGPFEMKISGNNSLVIGNVLIGEVWICSGQSNMEWPLSKAANAASEIPLAENPNLRGFYVPRNASDKPEQNITGRWLASSPAKVGVFSAVGYFFGRDLSKELGVPVGLIMSSVGGSPAEAWTRREALAGQMPEVLLEQEKAVANHSAALAKYQAGEPRLLEDWAAACEQAKAAGQPEPRKPAPPQDPQTSGKRPSGLFNAMIHPLIPFAIRGVIWYQGEGNNDRALAYQKLFPLLISDWRSQWGQGDFPFLFVQIAPNKDMSPEIREAQFLVWKRTPNTAMIVTTDVGDANDIHPTRKEPVGQRLALAARALAYGAKIEYSGPVFESVQFDGPRAIVTFSHVGGGLVAKDGELKGFIMAGADGKFAPAKALIKGSTVVVTADGVTKPAAVRYGWANVPNGNLFNEAGLPASPFRSDAPGGSKFDNGGRAAEYFER
ncbi:MAG: sialate O-acetylesterase [bacterium]